MDADCTYPGEEVPGLVGRLLNEDLDWITCDRLTKAEEGAMSGMHHHDQKHFEEPQRDVDGHERTKV